MLDSVKDFDRFLAEREGRTKQLRVLGRVCEVPVELPWWYMLLLDRMLREDEPIPGEVNAKLLKQLLSPEDYDYVTGHPEFRASWFWEIIAFGWLREDAPARAEPLFHTEDELKAAATGEAPGKNG